MNVKLEIANNGNDHDRMVRVVKYLEELQKQLAQQDKADGEIQIVAEVTVPVGGIIGRCQFWYNGNTLSRRIVERQDGICLAETAKDSTAESVFFMLCHGE